MVWWGLFLIGSIMVDLEVLRNVGHMCPSLVTVLFSSAVRDIRPNHPCASPSRRVDGRPVVCTGKCAMEAKIDVDGAGGLGEGENELCL